MITKKVILSLLALPLLFIVTCSEEDPAPVEPPQVLSNEYEGFLRLTFTNTFPAFNETTQIDVHIDKYGAMTFASGTLSYNADDNNGQSRIRRVGTLTLNPTGHHFDNNGEDWVDVDENTEINETMTVWYWDPNSQSWVQTINENITDTWHGGLGFNIDDAVLTGDIIQSSNAWGSVTWGLYLVVIP